jgi:hypothetical protein
MTMLGYFHYNRFGNGGFTDPGRGRPAPSVQTCPDCLCRVDSSGGALPNGAVLPLGKWIAQVCTRIKDDTVAGGFQAGCAAHAYPPFGEPIRSD